MNFFVFQSSWIDWKHYSLIQMLLQWRQPSDISMHCNICKRYFQQLCVICSLCLYCTDWSEIWQCSLQWFSLLLLTFCWALTLSIECIDPSASHSPLLSLNIMLFYFNPFHHLSSFSSEFVSVGIFFDLSQSTKCGRTYFEWNKFLENLLNHEKTNKKLFCVILLCSKCKHWWPENGS